MCVTSTQTALRVHKISCTVLIPLYKNNLNLKMCLFFLCPVLGCLVFSFIEWPCSLPRCVDSALILFVYFYGSRFCSLAINYASLNQSKGSKRYYWTGPLDWHIKYTNINWGEFMYSLKKYLNVLNIAWVWLT